MGQFNHARKLTTGIVTMAPRGKLEYHTHTCGESVTVLSGSLAMDVEGRRYTLVALDNITIPRGVAHQAENVSATQTATLHVALATDSPGRELVEDAFARRAMPDDSHGTPGAEHVTRLRTAQRSEAGPGTTFVDYFNHDLMPGIEMSGGYASFQPGGRLPAHVHDFDESICIIEGRATCIVEGRRYSLSECATAIEPRGRVHYFINESQSADGHDLGLCRSPSRADRGRRAMLHRRGKPVEIVAHPNLSDRKIKPFAVALTADFFDSDRRPKYRDVGLSVFESQPHITQRVLDEHRPRLGPDQIADLQGVIVLTPLVTAESVSRAANLLAIGRFGVGYDSVDVEACTQADVAVMIAAGAVDHSVAEATVGWMIALGHHLRVKDQLVRTGQWDQRHSYMGTELRDRLLGVIGLGGIGRATVELLRPFGMQPPTGLRSVCRPRCCRQTRRATGRFGRTAANRRLCFDPLPAERPNPRADRPAGAGLDETFGLLDQHGSGWHCGRGRPL